MKILLTGASGYTGARIWCRLKYQHEVVGLCGSNASFPGLVSLDIADRHAVAALVGKERPDWILHLAAIPNSARCLADEARARAVNEQGTQNLVDAANSVGAKVLFLSSDASFDPSLYGKLKKVGEDISKGAKAGWTILQPGMIFGLSPNTRNDRPFNRFLRNIDSGKPAVYDEVSEFYPTYLGHLGEVIAQVVERSILGQTIPVFVPEAVSRFQLAQDFLGPIGIEVTSERTGAITPLPPYTSDALKANGLLEYTYDMMWSSVLMEMRHYAWAVNRAL